MRHERLCHLLKGVVAKCDSCSQTFTNQELIWNAIGNWAKIINLHDYPIFSNFKSGCPLTKSCMEYVALRFSDDMEYYMRYPLQEMEKILKAIVLLQFNEHDYRHRKGCFKKSNECRFCYPKNIQDENALLVDWSSELSKRFSISANKPILYCYPFTLETKRHVSDLFLNTNNPIITKIFGYNNNVTIGNRNCIYYVTLYNTKGNQDEEQFPFLKHCTAPAKRIRRLRQEEEEIEKQFGNNGEI
jgi:hypothetical protein